MKPTATVRLSWRAQEDLVAFDLGEQGHLERGGVVLGYFDADHNRVCVEQLPENLFVEPYDPMETTTDAEAMAIYDTKADGLRTVGCWHTHTYVKIPVQCSEGDREAWRRLAATLGEPAYCGIVIGPTEVWESGYPGGCSWEDPVLGAWVATPEGQVRTATIQREPEWMANLASQVRFRERSTNG